MFQADQIGLLALRADLRERAKYHAQLVTPPALMDALISQG